MGTSIEVNLNIHDESTRDLCVRNIEKFPNMKISLNSPHLCDIYILDSDTVDSSLHNDLASLLETNPSLDIYFISVEASPSKILEVVNIGVRAYWIKPISDEKIYNALKKFCYRRGHSVPELISQSLGVSILGVKGGVGTTTLAVNIASLLQQSENNDSVALIDLKQPHGDADVLLGLTPQYDLSNLIYDNDRVDSYFLKQIMSRHGSGLYLLPPIKKYSDFMHMKQNVMSNILAHIYNAFPVVVFDQGSTINDIKLQYLYSSDFILLLCQQDIQNIKNLTTIYKFLTSYSVDFVKKIKIVINRYDKSDNLDCESIEKLLGQEIFWKIPSDYNTFKECSDTGKLLYELAPRSKVFSSISSLTNVLRNHCQSTPKETRNPVVKFFKNMAKGL